MSERTSEHRTDEISFTDQPGQPGAQEPDCFIDVNIYHIQREQAAPPSVEGDITEPPTDEQELIDEPEETAPLHQRHRHLVVTILVGFLCLLVAATLVI